MQRPPGNPSLTSGEWDQLQALLDRFEQAGPRGGPVEFAGFLPPADSPLHLLALQELVKCDLEMRWRNSNPVLLEDYLKCYPQIRGDSKALTQLLYEEFCVRKRCGDKPPLSGYRARFPDQFAELERLAEGQDDLTDVLPPLKSSQPIQDPRSTGSLVPVFGGYKLIERIGRGNFGEVWRAEAPGGVEAAIKIIFRPLHHSEAKKELQSLELTKRLRHPFLLQTQAFWSMEDRLMIAMELADGSLRDRLHECAKAGHAGIPVEELLVYTRESCEALDFLHSKQLLHRDIKPDNILLLEHHAKVADFGLTRLLQAQRARMTVSGTPAFMPPETWSGQATERSDQYSLAGSYVELRLNRHLFPSRDMAGAMLDHLQKTPDVEALPEPEQRVLLRALGKKPEDRYDSCLEFWEALRQAVGPAPRGSLPSTGVSSGQTPTTPQVFDTGGSPGTLKFGRSGTQNHPSTAAGQSLPGQPLVGDASLGARRRRPNLLIGAAAALVLLGGVVGVGIAYRNKMSERGSPPAVYLPDGFQRDDEAEVVSAAGQDVYKQIAHVFPDQTKLVFVLIPKTGAADPPPFYMLRDKVTNHAFTQFSLDDPAAIRDASWRLGAAGENEIQLGVDDFPFHPVVRVSVDDANRFVAWQHGVLPTAQQWDKAAGRTDGAVGPFVGDGQGLQNQAFGVGLGKLLPGNRQPIATTLFGCRDMAGNGYEWTRTARGDNEGTVVPFDNPNWNERILLRGQTYFADAGYRFSDRPNSRYRFRNPQTGDKGGPSAEVGFRIVLELPPAP